MEDMYERNNAQNKASTIRSLVNLKFREGRSIADHLSEFQDLVNQLITMKIDLNENYKLCLS